MAGTSGAHIVHDRPTFDGHNLVILPGGSTSAIFTTRVSSAIIHNTTGDYLSVIINTAPVATGNGFQYIAPFSALSFGDYHGAEIISIFFTDLQITGNGGGVILVNGLYS